MAEKQRLSTKPQLEVFDYRLRHFYIQQNAEFASEERVGGSVTLTSGVALAEEDAYTFQVTLGAVFPADEISNYPYVMEVAIEGDFRSVYPSDNGRIPAFLASNAMLILWGMARGIAGPVTAMFEEGLFVWPTVSFDNFVRDAAGKDNSGISEFFTPYEYVSHLEKERAAQEAKPKSKSRKKRGD